MKQWSKPKISTLSEKELKDIIIASASGSCPAGVVRPIP
jgi:hypothetical protein